MKIIELSTTFFNFKYKEVVAVSDTKNKKNTKEYDIIKPF